MDTERLTDYIHRPLRHHLVFTSADVEGISYVNLGYELARKLRDDVGSKNIAAKAFEALKEILNSNINQHPLFGYYIAIKNLQILFEPELHLSFTDILDQWSKSLCLFILKDEFLKDEDIAIPDALML